MISITLKEKIACCSKLDGKNKAFLIGCSSQFLIALAM